METGTDAGSRALLPPPEYTDVERWKPIPGYGALYSVSSHGRIRATGAWIGKTVSDPSKVVFEQLSVRTRDDGYCVADLYLHGQRETVYLHRVVAEAFCDNDDPETNVIVDHIDGRRAHNHPQNLEWVTTAENNARGDKSKTWMFEYEGRKLEIKSLAPYCREQGLDLTTMRRVHDGELENYYGYSTWL